MAIIGFIFLVFIGLVLSIWGIFVAWVSYAWDSFEILVIIPISLGLALLWLAFHNSPFSIILN